MFDNSFIKSKYNSLDAKQKMKIQDTVFIVMTVLFSVYYIFMLQRGFGAVDEAFYSTIPHRMMKGDGLLVHEWQISQFSSLLNYIPFKIYYLLKGSTEGVILYSRYFYIVIRLITTVLLYLQTRKEGLISLFTALLYIHYAESGMLTLSYNSFPVFFLVWTSLLLFCGKSAKWKFFAAGITVSGMVLAQPLTAVIYFLYCIIVFVRIFTKKEDSMSYLFNIKSWAYMTSTIVICAAITLGYIFSVNGFSQTIAAIPYFFTDSEYVFPLISEGDPNLYDGYFGEFLKHFGIYYVWVLVIMLDRKRLQRRKFYLSVSTVMMILMYILPFIVGNTLYMFTNCRQLSMMFFALSVYLLLKDKNKRWFYFWLAGLLVSALVNFSEDFSYLYMIGSVCCNIAGAFFVRDMMRELRSEKELPTKKFTDVKTYKKIVWNRRLRSFCSVILVVIISMQVAVECCLLPFELDYLPLEVFCHNSNGEKISVKSEKGPMKNLYTTKTINDRYLQLIDDLDTIDRLSDGNIYIYGLLSWGYLYLDRDYTPYSAWYVESDFSTRQVMYFDLHPEKFPEYVYIPKYDGYFDIEEGVAKERLALLQSLYSCEYEETKAGYIVKVSR